MQYLRDPSNVLEWIKEDRKSMIGRPAGYNQIKFKSDDVEIKILPSGQIIRMKN